MTSTNALAAERAAPPAHAWRRHRRLAASLVVLHGLLFLWTTTLWPAFQAPDEVTHVDYVVAHRHGEWLDGPGDRQLQSGVLAAFAQSPRTGARMHLGEAPPMLRSDRKSFDALGPRPVQPAGLPNQMVQHPPLYYGLAAGWSYVLPSFDHQRFDVQVWWLRLLSVLLLLPVPALLLTSGLRLTGSTSVAVTAALLPLALPSYVRAGASVNNDALLVLLGTGLLSLLARVVTGDASRRTAAVVGLTWGAMLLTKGTALILPPVIACAYLMARRGRVRAAALPLLIAASVGVAVGGWWWVRNVALYGSIQPSGYGPAWPVSRVYHGLNPHGTRPEFLHKFFHILTQRVFGSLGLIDEPQLRFGLMAALTSLLLVLLAVGLVAGFPRAGNRRLAAVVLTLPVALCLVSLLAQSYSYFVKVRLLPGIQVRYFLPFILGTAVAVAVALHRVLRRWAPVLTLVGVLGYQLFVAQFVLRVQYGTSAGSVAHRTLEGLRFVVGWAPWPPAVTLLTSAGAAAAGGTLAVQLLRHARESAEAVPAPG